ncbi:putative NAD dependent epimerase/dehydratase family/Male sterility protein [Leishmania naiffi]|uniref:Fatty acyl-CoA reductase n=1 Tax=Leishmania naiffi TaxID=5678 RepID=A0AAW3CCQ6_9TRYP
MSLDVRAGFSNRTVFMTGGSGLVGKVLLYKILKEMPDVKCVYLLMRGKRSRRLKKYLNAQERLDLEVLGSPCFEPLRQQAGEAKWRELCQRVKAVQGDITLDHVGLSEEDRAMLANEVNFIVHLAATVNFNERLDLALQMNTLGGLRVLTLAKTCRHLEAMVHVSTCYVNYRRKGRQLVNEERLYPLGFDPEEMCKRVLAMNPSEVEMQSALLLKEHSFPNTYTFTKCIGEQLIYKSKESVPIVIVRPSIIGCSYSDPFPGWVDALTAAGGLMLTVALGVVHEVLCGKDLIADVIPVDYVANVILKALFKTQQHYKVRCLRAGAAEPGEAVTPAQADAGAVRGSVISVSMDAKGGAGRMNVETRQAAAAETNTFAVVESPTTDDMSGGATTEADEGLPFIYQAATSSSENRVTWARLHLSLANFMKGKCHPKGLSPMKVTMITSQRYYRIRYYLLRYMPYIALRFLMQLPPPIGSPKKLELAKKLGRAVRRADLLTWEFLDFTLSEWVYASVNARHLDGQLNEYSRKAFSFDPYSINWYAYTQVYTYGIFKHIIRETGDFQMPKVPPSATEVFERASSL